FADFESSLVRLGKDYCRRGKCAACPVAEECESWVMKSPSYEAAPDEVGLLSDLPGSKSH
ncbi:MAG: hypothetical protein ACE5MB_11930, partial [Anaerolineae bacterium]